MLWEEDSAGRHGASNHRSLQGDPVNVSSIREKEDD